MNDSEDFQIFVLGLQPARRDRPPQRYVALNVNAKDDGNSICAKLQEAGWLTERLSGLRWKGLNLLRVGRVGCTVLTKEDTVKALTAWNLDAFVEAVNAKAPELAWRDVFEQLDQPTLDAPGAEAFRLLLDVHKKAVGGKFPGAVLLGNWKNGKAQLDLLSQTVSLLEQRLTLAEDKGSEVEDALSAVLANQTAMMDAMHLLPHQQEEVQTAMRKQRRSSTQEL